MFVKALTLKNIRSLKDSSFRFSKSINLLVGHNNSGKSTIIKALNKLQNNHSLSVEDVRKGVESGKIYIDLESISEAERKTFVIGEKDSRRSFPNTDRAKIAFGLYNDLIPDKRKQDAVLFDGHCHFNIDKLGVINAQNKNGAVEEPITFHSLPNIETQNNFIYPLFAKRKYGHYGNNQMGERETYSVSEDLRNLAPKIQRLSNPGSPKFKVYDKWVRDILGFSIGIVPHGETASNIGIFTDDKTVIPVDSMGEGVVNVLGLIATLLTEDNKLYLIEEPENDIHPAALKKLLQLIIDKSKKNQFVISTHSNIVVKYLGIEGSKLFHLKWKPGEENEEMQIPTTEVAELENEPEARIRLLEELGYDLFDFDLYKSYLIFEEPSAEALVKEFLIPIFYPSLQGQVKTIAATGADDLQARFQDFLRLFVYIHQSPLYVQRAWVIADGDFAGTDNIERLKGKFKSWPADHFITLAKSNIEQYYPGTFSKKFEDLMHNTPKEKQWEKKKEFSKAFFDHLRANISDYKTELAVTARELLEILSTIQNKLNDKQA